MNKNSQFQVQIQVHCDLRNANFILLRNFLPVHLMHKIDQKLDQFDCGFCAEMFIWSQCFALNENMTSISLEQIFLQGLKNYTWNLIYSCAHNFK